MTDDQKRRIWVIENSCDGRTELAERIVGLEDENKKLIVKLNAEHIARQNVEDENRKLRELTTFYLGCLTKGHVNCDSCAFSGEDNCDHGRKVIESAKQVGIEVNG